MRDGVLNKAANAENLEDALNAVVSFTNGETYRYEVGEDGSIWLMSENFASMMWPDAETFLFGANGLQSVFSFVRDILSILDRNFGGTLYETLMSDPIDIFCVKNKWMAAYAGCGSKEELEIKLAAMETPRR